MTRLSKPDFKSAIKDIESVFLFEVRNNRVYLLGDMEYGGESQTPRLEWMNLEIDKSQAITHAVNDSRNSGGNITIMTQLVISAVMMMKCRIFAENLITRKFM